MNPKPWIICDIDGTISDFAHRLHLRKDGDKPDWEAFNRAALLDRPIASTLSLLRLARSQEWYIALVTGRTGAIRQHTVFWLAKHAVPYDLLLMRHYRDHRSDVEVKRDIFTKWLADRDIAFALEDRDCCVEMWRDLGIACFQVSRGAY